MDNETIFELGERVAVLETKGESFEKDLKEIKDKLDELLHLKSRGMGALWLVSLIVGSGVLGLVTAIFSFFHSKPHL